MALPRLRQVALAATDLEGVAGQLRRALQLDEPYRDPGVAHFGLANVVFTVGDTFLEVVSPVRDGTAAGRYLTRQGGDSGYMAMVQVPDAAVARERLTGLGVRIVWDHTEPDIVDLHLHPRDVPGTLLALDAAEPQGSWRWGGPEWTASVPAHRPGGLRGLVVATDRPADAAARWAAVLGMTETSADGTALLLDDTAVRFVPPDGRRGIVGLTVAVPAPTPAPFEVAGVLVDLVQA